MRSGGCTVQQALTSEAASVVKQAVVLAKCRGHAQVTPLHVANTLLASSSGLLRTACLQSQTQTQSHPLRCKALELCFNVALNRLPTSSSSSSSPMLLGHHYHHQSQSQSQSQNHSQHPSISNALVAAFKRAQAHQRRGSIVENQQQQPILSVKIDLEQLIISILDDPSVSRVMKEAGFSSTQVKTNVEHAIISLDLMCKTSQSPSPSSNFKENNNNNHIFLQSGELLKASGNKVSSTPNSFPHHVKDEDVMSVVESLMNKRRKSIVIVGECIGSLEGVIKGVMDKVDNINNGDNCCIAFDQSLKEIKLINVPLSTFANITREEVDQRIGELTCLLKSLVTKGVVLYLGDLKWITDFRANNNENNSRNGLQGTFGYYCPVEHMVMELGRLICNIGGNGKVWLVGIATFQTYMRCRSGHNSLESIWGLHPITVPAGSLGLSLNSDSDTQLELRSKASENGSSGMILDIGDDDDDHEKQLTCCDDCSSKFKVEALRLQQNNASKFESSTLSSSSFPSWLKDERQRLNSNQHHDHQGVSVKQLYRKWNSICNSSHKKTKTFERSLTFPTSTSPSSIFNSSCLDPEVHTWREGNDTTREPSLRIYIPEHSDSDPRNAFSSNNPNSTPNSASSSDQIMEMEYYISMFKEFNSENLNILSNALEEKVPWQKEAIKEISRTILESRSGMIKRNGEAKEETWLFFQGQDVQAKEKIAIELAKVVFGSYSRFTSIGLSSFSSMKLDYYKRSRDEQSCSHIERFAQAVCSNPHRVFFVEDVEQVDYCSQRGIKKAIERGKITNSSGEQVSLSDAIIILSCDHDSFISSRSSRGVSPNCDGSDNEEIKEATRSISPNCVSLDLNISIDDHETSVDDIRLLESVDRCIMFRIQEM